MKLSVVVVLAVVVGCALGGDVLLLGDSDFSAKLSDHPLALVKFFAPWFVVPSSLPLIPVYTCVRRMAIYVAPAFSLRTKCSEIATCFRSVDATFENG